MVRDSNRVECDSKQRRRAFKAREAPLQRLRARARARQMLGVPAGRSTASVYDRLCRFLKTESWPREDRARARVRGKGSQRESTVSISEA